jgi:diguanylate cyclase (GGDEF)-like protein
MINEQELRHVLIVDDQQEIHDTFKRILADQRSDDSALADFESRFLAGSPALRGEKSSPPTLRYSLEHALCGEQAAERVRASMAAQRPYSVAFVDMRMPQGMDGLETTETLWKIDPNLHVVICTAYSDHAWEDVVRRLGHNDRLLLLKKPFETDEAKQLALALSEKARLAEVQRKKVADLGQEIQLRRRAEETMREMAHRDALTKLPNRPYLIEKLSKIVRLHRACQAPRHAVLFLDLDNFKIINDSLGHDAGDDLLNQVAARLKECVREQDTAGRVSEESEGETVRLGGDEFVVLLERLEDPQHALVVADRIVRRISQPFTIADRLVTVGTSVGIAYIDDRINDAHEALRNADTAMYQAKHSGKGQFAVFDQTMHDDVVARMELEDQLRRAIDRQGFKLNYQPIVDLQTGEIQGVEVLIRWTSDDGQPVSPGKFIPMIEEIGQISRVGEWILERSMQEFSDLANQIPYACHRNLYLGVNVSRRHLSDPYFFERLNAILLRTGFDRRRLKLEMNQSSGERDSGQTLHTLLELHHSGVGIQIDDFGKGQSSLTCFQAYPIEAVKIDRTFTASIATDHSHAVITQAIVQLAHHLSAKIVAQGVESENQLQSLRLWGCDAAQGFLFSAPLDSHSLAQLLCNPLQSEGIRILRRPSYPLLPCETGGVTHPVGQR